jgi:glycosyltransferase involved in cell wall biosynthesis
MKILIVHQHYLMPGQPGGSRFNELARMWSEAGHQVTVVAGNVNYNTGQRPAAYDGTWTLREHDGQVVVWRCHVPRSYGRSYLGRMWAFLGFTASATTAALRAGRHDVVIGTSPPLVVVLPALLASRLRRPRVPWVFEVRDLWPESAITTGVLTRSSPLTRLLYAMERIACRDAALINVLTPAFREDLLRRGLANDERIVFIPNGADLDLFSPGPRDNDIRHALGWGDRFVVMYAGAHGRANAIGQLIEAAERLRHRPDILIASVGDGPERPPLAAEAERRGLTNIIFHGPQPKERMPDVVNASDAGCAVLQNNITFRGVYPNKVFDYMACARPTVLGIDGVARQLVCDEAQAGIFATPEDGQALAAAIAHLADHPDEARAMGERGRKWVLANASREALARRYLGVLERLTSREISPSKVDRTRGAIGNAAGRS